MSADTLPYCGECGMSHEDDCPILRVHDGGELGDDFTTTEELLERAGRALDRACSHDIVGEVLFERANGKMYVLTVEAVIGEASPEYVDSLDFDYCPEHGWHNEDYCPRCIARNERDVCGGHGDN